MLLLLLLLLLLLWVSFRLAAGHGLPAVLTKKKSVNSRGCVWQHDTAPVGLREVEEGRWRRRGGGGGCGGAKEEEEGKGGGG